MIGDQFHLIQRRQATSMGDFWHQEKRIDTGYTLAARDVFLAHTLGKTPGDYRLVRCDVLTAEKLLAYQEDQNDPSPFAGGKTLRPQSEVPSAEGNADEISNAIRFQAFDFRGRVRSWFRRTFRRV